MYCRECGSQISHKAEFCTSCGFSPFRSHNYCQNCGAETKGHQEMCISCGKMLINQSEKYYAGFWLRVVASVIDSIIIGVPLSIIGVILGVVEVSLAADSYLMGDNALVLMDIIEVVTYLLGALVGVFYYAGMHSSKWQATLGKRMVGIKVIHSRGGRISFLRGVWRYIATFFSGITLYIGYMMAGFTERKQALHDKMAETLVVRYR